MASPLNDPKLEALLDRLHAQSDAQIDVTEAYFEQRERDGSLDDDGAFPGWFRTHRSRLSTGRKAEPPGLCAQLESALIMPAVH